MRITKTKAFTWAKGHAKLLATLTTGAVLGVGGSAVVMAAIPDSGGVIHACYTTGLLARVKIIDSASQTCGTNETAITWNQTGPAGATGAAGATGPQGPAGANGAVGYGTLISNFDELTGDFVNFTVSNDSNITGVTAEVEDGTGDITGACITVNGSVHGVLSSEAGNGSRRGTAVKVSGNWVDAANQPESHCPDDSTANVWTQSTQARFFFVY